jgi:hypothetical protein
MAVRILTYVGLLYRDLIRAGQLVEGKLPPVLPIALYNGARRWNAAEELRELMQPGPRALEPYLPRVRYLLIDERRYRDCERAPLRNLVAALYRLEISRTRSDIEEILRALHQWLSSAEQLSLRRAFAARSRGLILTRFPSVETA